MRLQRDKFSTFLLFNPLNNPRLTYTAHNSHAWNLEFPSVSLIRVIHCSPFRVTHFHASATLMHTLPPFLSISYLSPFSISFARFHLPSVSAISSPFPFLFSLPLSHSSLSFAALSSATHLFPRRLVFQLCQFPSRLFPFSIIYLRLLILSSSNKPVIL